MTDLKALKGVKPSHLCKLRVSSNVNIPPIPGPPPQGLAGSGPGSLLFIFLCFAYVFTFLVLLVVWLFQVLCAVCIHSSVQPPGSFHGSSIETKNMQGPGQLSPGHTLRFPEVFLALPFNPFGIKGLKSGPKDWQNYENNNIF